MGRMSHWEFLDSCGIGEWRDIPPAPREWTWQQLAAREERIIRGVIVAEEGWFREGDDPRGQFNLASLNAIVAVLRENDGRQGGTRCRFGHTDEVGQFVGRIKSPRLSTTTNSEGSQVRCVRADLHLAPAAAVSPAGNLWDYVWD